MSLVLYVQTSNIKHKPINSEIIQVFQYTHKPFLLKMSNTYIYFGGRFCLGLFSKSGDYLGQEEVQQKHFNYKSKLEAPNK